MRVLLGRNKPFDAVGREEAWLKERLDRHRDPGDPFEMTQGNGVTMLVHEQKLPDGTTINIASNITDRKKAEQGLRESEDRFRDFADIGHDFLWETDPEHRYTFISERLVEVTGIPTAQFLGVSRKDVVMAGLDATAAKEHLAVIDAREPCEGFGYWIDRPAGLKHFTLSGKPVYSIDGEFLGYRGVGSDTTAQKRTEEALSASELQFRDYAEAASDWFWEMDAELRFTALPEDYHRMLGVPPGSMIGRTADETERRYPSSEMQELWEKSSAARQPFRNLIAYREDPAGHKRWIRIAAVPIFDDSGEFRGYQVHAVGDGRAALAVLSAAPRVDLLLADVVLPGEMSGPALAQAGRRDRTALKVLYMSGYAADAIARHGRLDPGVEVLAKPFSMEDLGRKLRAVLDG